MFKKFYAIDSLQKVDITTLLGTFVYSNCSLYTEINSNDHVKYIWKVAFITSHYNSPCKYTVSDFQEGFIFCKT